jgi:group I intron endonuclease
MQASVYAIRDKRNPEIDLYVGSTVRPYCVRFAQHVIDAFYLRHPPTKIRKHMHDEGVENFEVHILEKCDPDIRREREQFHMDRLKPEFNVQRAFGPKPAQKRTRKPLTEAQRETRLRRRRERYANDPVYRERVRARARAHYHKKRVLEFLM